MFAAKEDGVWRKYSTAEFQQLVNSLSMGLMRAGIGYQDGTSEGREKEAILQQQQA